MDSARRCCYGRHSGVEDGAAFSRAICGKTGGFGVETRVITAREADEILQDGGRRSSGVCFAVGMGDLPWNPHWVETLRRARSGSWILADGKTTKMLTTEQYNEIILSEDDELLGIRFRYANGAIPGFEVSVFVAN